jgi:hypothetical protein
MLIGEFRAVYVSHKKVYTGSRLRRTRKLFSLDCRFTSLDGSGSITVRIHADNPVMKDLELRNVYRFEEIGHVGFKAIRDVVTDLDNGTVYRIARA